MHLLKTHFSPLMRYCHSTLTLTGRERYCAVHAGKYPPAAVLTVDLGDFISLNCALIRGGNLPDMETAALQGLSSKVCRKKKVWDIRMEYCGMDFFFLAQNGTKEKSSSFPCVYHTNFSVLLFLLSLKSKNVL